MHSYPIRKLIRHFLAGRATVLTIALLTPLLARGQAALDDRSIHYKRDSGIWLKVRKNEAGLNFLGVTEAPPDRSPVALQSPGTAFAAARAYPTGSWPEAVAIADLNDDGRNDVVMTTSFYFHTNDHSILVFFQNTVGQLGAPVRYDAGADAPSVVVADFTGDGKNDIVVGKKGAGLRLFVQLGSGNFQTFIDFPTVNANWICSGDFNNDGLSDVAGIGWGSKQVDVFLQDADGGLVLSAHYPANYSGYNDIEAGDVNGDGLSDIVVMNGQTYAVPNLSVLLQTNGGFAAAIPYDLGGNELTQGVGVGDLTGDGRNDVVVSYGGNSPGARLSVFRQGLDGALTAGLPYVSYDIPEPVAVADVNLDGRPDIITLHGGWNRAGVYFQTGPGSIQAEQLYTIPYASHYNPHGLAVGDVNGDEMPDLVIADYNSGLVVLTNRLSPPPFQITSIALNRNAQVVLSARYRGGHGSCVVEASDALPHWAPIGVMTGPAWTDADAPVPFKRFYRLVAQ